MKASCKLLLLVSPLFLELPARADAEEALAIVPITRRGEHLDEVNEMADAVHEELSRRGITHLHGEELQRRVTEQHSRDAEPLSEQSVEDFTEATHKALEAVNRAEWPTAFRLLESALGIADRTLETFNRSDLRAQQLLLKCMLDGRAHYQARELEAASTRVKDCAWRSPTVELPPDQDEIPKEVVDLLTRARRGLAEDGASLLLHSTEPNCRARLNGRVVGDVPLPGHPPLELAGLARRPYRVQVECPAQPIARVHMVTPGGEPMTIDPVFDAALATESGKLHLNYTSRDEARERAHLRTLREDVLDVSQVIAVVRLSDRRWRLQRMAKGNGATEHLPVRYTEEALRSALDKLLGDVVDTPDAGTPTTNSTDARWQVPSWAKAVGASAIGLGAAAFAVGAWQHLEQHQRGDRVRGLQPGDRPYLPAVEEWQGYRGRELAYAFFAVGTVATTAGALGLLRAAPHAALPNWKVLLPVGLAGGLGLLWGVLDLAKGERCDRTAERLRFCVAAQNRRDRGALLLLASVPLSSFVVAGIWRRRSAPKHSATPSIHPKVSKTGAVLQLRWEL